MEYEQEFENALMQLCGVCVTFNLKFRAFNANDIQIDVDKHEINAPLLEKDNILDYFKRNGFTIKLCVGLWYQISVVS